jgi:hypothetical protein
MPIDTTPSTVGAEAGGSAGGSAMTAIGGEGHSQEARLQIANVA